MDKAEDIRRRNLTFSDKYHSGKRQFDTSHVLGNNMADTINMARRARLDQGNHESEVTFGGEHDLHQTLIFCDKNPDHTKFIPVTKFKIEDLPPGYHDNNIVELIKAQSDLTVRESVNYTSENRPEFYPGSEEQFPFHNYGGCESMTRTGSGWVSRVFRYTKEDNRICECEKCSRPTAENPHTEWGEIEIMTACHVVYDSLEASHTVCHFFYDSPELDLDKCHQLSGMEIVEADIAGDRCVMKHKTHDIDLVDQLNKTWNHYKEVNEKVFGSNRFRDTPVSSLSRFLSAFDCDSTLTIITSHPHGCSKQISIGEYTQRRWTNLLTTKAQYSYTSATCPGSSGAPVNALGSRLDMDLWCEHPHHGRCEGHGINKSGLGRVSKCHIWSLVVAVVGMTLAWLYSRGTETFTMAVLMSLLAIGSVLLEQLRAPRRYRLWFWMLSVMMMMMTVTGVQIGKLEMITWLPMIATLIAIVVELEKYGVSTRPRDRLLMLLMTLLSMEIPMFVTNVLLGMSKLEMIPVAFMQMLMVVPTMAAVLWMPFVPTLHGNMPVLTRYQRNSLVLSIVFLTMATALWIAVLRMMGKTRLEAPQLMAVFAPIVLLLLASHHVYHKTFLGKWYTKMTVMVASYTFAVAFKE